MAKVLTKYVGPKYAEVKHSDGEIPLITIPVADLEASHYYAAVAYGMVGLFTPHGAADPDVADVYFRYGSLTPIGTIRHRMDLRYPQLGAASTTNGQSFFMIYLFTTPASGLKDIHLIAKADGAATATESIMRLDSPVVELWDLTNLGSSNYVAGESNAGWTLGLTPQNLLGGAPMPQDDWLFYHAVHYVHTGNVGMNMGYHWTQNAPSGGGRLISQPQPFPEFIGQYNRSIFGRRGSKYTILALGDVKLASVTGSPTPYIQAATILDPNIHGGVSAVRASFLAIRASALAQLQYSESMQDFGLHPISLQAFEPVGSFNERLRVVDGHQGSPMPVTATSSHRFRQWQCSAGWTPRTVYNLLEVNGRQESPKHTTRGFGHLILDRYEVVQITRSYFGTRDTRDCFAPIMFDQQPSHPAGTDLTPDWHLPFIYSFTPDTNFVYPSLVLETAGSEIVVQPQKEALSLAGLDAMPVEPTTAVQVQELAEVVDSVTPTQHAQRWPRFLKPRRRYALTWHVDNTDKETIVAFLKTRENEQGAFQWTPPDEIAGSATPFVLQGSQWTVEPVAKGGASAVWQINATVLELVYVGP